MPGFFSLELRSRRTTNFSIAHAWKLPPEPDCPFRPKTLSKRLKVNSDPNPSQKKLNEIERD